MQETNVFTEIAEINHYIYYKQYHVMKIVVIRKATFLLNTLASVTNCEINQ